MFCPIIFTDLDSCIIGPAREQKDHESYIPIDLDPKGKPRSFIRENALRFLESFPDAVPTIPVTGRTLDSQKKKLIKII